MNKTSVMVMMILVSMVLAMTVSAWSGGPPDEKTGAPGESDCTDCHNTFALNSGNGNLSINGIPSYYTPGDIYVGTVILEDPGQQRWGFELTVLDATNNMAGTLNVTDTTNTQSSLTGGKIYIKHTSTGTYDGTTDGPVSWSFNWTAPSAGTGAVTFYAAGNAADSSGNTNGDYIYTTSFFSDEFAPTIDYILLSESPSGPEINDNITLDLGTPLLIYASGYNNSVNGSIGLVNVQWSATPLTGGDGTYDNSTGTSTTFTGTDAGWVEIKGVNNTLGINDTIEMELIATSLEIDEIIITEAPNGNELTTVVLGVSGTVTAFASGYNSTSPTYIDLVDANWTANGGTWLPENGTTSSDFTAGSTGGLFTQTAQSVLPPGLSDTFSIFIDLDTPSITHTPVTNGTSGSPIQITADVTDNNVLEEVFLHYKKPTGSTYTTLQMSASGDTYSADIPGNEVTSEGLEYYIKASDNAAPPNLIYFEDGGQTATEPTSSNDIDISISAGDVFSPSINSHSPTGTNVAVDTNIQVVFSEAMGEVVSEGAFSITPSVSGAFLWSANTLTFTPTADIDYNTIYNVTIGTGATDLAGNSLALYSWEFTTIPGTTTGPEVDEFDPEGTNIPVEAIVIEIWFTEDMDKDITEDAISITPDIEYIESWPMDDQIRLSPVDPLEYDTTYTVTISTNATNENGQPMVDEESWSFHTEKAPKEEFDWNAWEPIITGITILISLIAFLIGFLTLRKKRGKLRKYMEQVDNTFNEYKKNYQECEKELITLRENIKKEVKEGKIEENHFLILDKKIDDYLREMKALEKGGAASGAVSPEAESVGELKDAE